MENSSMRRKLRNYRSVAENAEKTTVEAEAAGKGRKRKIEFGESQVATPSVHRKSRCLAVVKPENSNSPADSGYSTCESVGSDHVLASCCSCNEWGDVAENPSQRIDLEETGVASEFSVTSSGDSFVCSNRRETTRSSKVVHVELGEVASTAKPGKVDCRSREEKMVSESDIEEFFISAEMELQKKFIHKYNFDIVKDHPVEGRYEWVQNSPKALKMIEEKKNKMPTA